MIGKGFSRAQAEDAKLRRRELGDGGEKWERMEIQKENELISAISICFKGIPKLCGEERSQDGFFCFSFFLLGTSLTVRHCTTQVKKSKQRCMVSDG